MKRFNQVISLAVCTALLVGGVDPLTVSAKEVNTNKEEVVYAMLDSAGNVTGLYVVNIYSGESEIIDYGEYSNVKNLTTTDELVYENGMVSISTDANKLYYQGDLATTDIPWNIKILYYMDGEEYSAEEIAGLSGALKITIDISENEKCDESFWKGYALQASMTLDSEMATNIVAEGATKANVGSDIQLSYIILPGKGKNITIMADVTDFEMDAISINGVKLNLSSEIDDTELMEKVSEIQEAAEAINDGTSELNDGAASLNSGASDLKDGMATLNSGISQIYDALVTINGKSSTLTTGSGKVVTALTGIQNALSNVSLDASNLRTLSESSTAIKDSIVLLHTNMTDMDAYVQGNYSTDPYLTAYSNGMLNGLAALDTSYANFDTAVQGMVTSLSSLTTNMASLKNAIDSLVTSYGTLDSGINEYTDAVAQILAGYEKIYNGSASLLTGTADLYSGTSDLVSGCNELYSGTTDFYEATANMDTEISDTIDETLDTLTGADEKVISFVSEDNTNIESVLFVIKTPAIEKGEIREEIEEVEEKLNIWQKFLRLFGLY